MSAAASSSYLPSRPALLMQRRGKVSPESGDYGESNRRAFTLDPNDVGIEQSIRRLEKKSFILQGVLPEV